MKRFARRPIAILVILSVTIFAVWEYLQWREVWAENALHDLWISNFQIKDGTFDDALRQVVEELHARGHPEVRLHIYEDGRQSSDYRAMLANDKPVDAASIDPTAAPDAKKTQYRYDSGMHMAIPNRIDPGSPATFALAPLRLSELLTFLSDDFNLPCSLRGHDLIAAHTPGTLARYRHATIQCTSRTLPQSTSDKELRDWLNQLSRGCNCGDFRFYEGMTVKVRRSGKALEIYGPEETVQLLRYFLKEDPSWWEEKSIQLRRWWHDKVTSPGES
jgi:hypothetical protein